MFALVTNGFQEKKKKCVEYTLKILQFNKNASLKCCFVG